MSPNPQQSPLLIWFQLYESVTGKSFKGTTASSLLRSSLVVPVVDQFRDAVKAKYDQPTYLKDIPSSALIVFKNKAAFDSRNAAVQEEKEEPLKSSHTLDGLGKTKDEALIVVVKDEKLVTFVEYLKHGQINQPDDRILASIAKRYPQELYAAICIGVPGPCVNLYNTVKELPSTDTLCAIESFMKISTNTPSLAQPNIRVAADLHHGKHLYIKLLRFPDTTKSFSVASKEYAIITEINTCAELSQLNMPGLVKCDVVKVTVHHSEGLDVSAQVWAVVKMKRYMSSLAEAPQLSEKWLYKGFSRILQALKSMHELNLVHMDVKGDNVFVDEDSNLDLGDFGSTRPVGARIWSFTEAYNPYFIPFDATIIPAMDYVLLCVMIAVELNRKKWADLRGSHHNVQEHLIIKKLDSIKDVEFKKEIMELFIDNLKIVREHLEKF